MSDDNAAKCAKLRRALELAAELKAIGEDLAGKDEGSPFSLANRRPGTPEAAGKDSLYHTNEMSEKFALALYRLGGIKP